MTKSKTEDGTSIIFKSTKELVLEEIARIGKRHEEHQEFERLRDGSKGVRVSGIPTGFPDIDYVIDGLPCGVGVVGARPEEGLTDFGLNVALNASATHKVLYVCPQFPSKLLMRRLMCIASMVNMKTVNEGFLAERDFPKLTGVTGRLEKEGILSFYDGKIDPYKFLKVCEHFQEKFGTQLVVLDRFQSLFPRGGASEGDSYYWRAKEISGTLHDLVAERGLTLLLLSEVKKRRGSERLTTDHLRDWGVFEYTGRPIILFEREGGRLNYETQEFADGNVSVTITNNVAGEWTSDARLIYLKECGRFNSSAKVDDYD